MTNTYERLVWVFFEFSTGSFQHAVVAYFFLLPTAANQLVG
jgi:hypothetical protein